jgi:hypothetical protein
MATRHGAARIGASRESASRDGTVTSAGPLAPAIHPRCEPSPRSSPAWRDVTAPESETDWATSAVPAGSFVPRSYDELEAEPLLIERSDRSGRMGWSHAGVGANVGPYRSDAASLGGGMGTTHRERDAAPRDPRAVAFMGGGRPGGAAGEPPEEDLPGGPSGHRGSPEPGDVGALERPTDPAERRQDSGDRGELDGARRRRARSESDLGSGADSLCGDAEHSRARGSVLLPERSANDGIRAVRADRGPEDPVVQPSLPLGALGAADASELATADPRRGTRWAHWVRAPWRVLAWFIGPEGTRYLGRYVEVRLSTLLMGTTVLVISLSLVGIFLNLRLARRAAEDPNAAFEIDDEARAAYDAAFASKRAASDSDSLASVDSASAVSGADATRIAPDRSRPWTGTPSAEEGVGPEFRDVGARVEPPDSVDVGTDSSGSDSTQDVFDPRRHWVRIRGQMNDKERDRLYRHLAEKVLPHFNAYALPSRADRSFAYKEIVWTPMSDRPDRYYIYVGPFATRDDAQAARRTFETDLQGYPQLRLGPYFDSLLTTVESPTIAEYRARSRAAST